MCQDSNGMFNYKITFIMFVFIYMKQYILSIKENMMCQDSNRKFNYRIKFKFNQKIYIYIYIKIMRCKIVRTQKLM